jgi:hypothetical protein
MTVRHFRIWHHPEVLSGARHDCYRRGTGRRPEIADSAEFDPKPKFDPIDSRLERSYNFDDCVL